MQEEEKNKAEQQPLPLDFINPIDAKKIAENPGLLAYASNVGGFVIKPTEEGHIKATALAAMEQQTSKQMLQLYEQMQILAQQAKALQDRVEISTQIYQAEISFQPVIGQIYYLYLKRTGRFVVSMIAPHEWVKTMPYEEYKATVMLMADHTWDVKETNQ